MASWDHETLSRVQTLHESIKEQPIPPSVTTHVIIPIAATQEAKTLKESLPRYAAQDADPATWEILLFVNRVANGDNIEPDERTQETLDVIESFRRDNPHINTRVINAIYQGEPPPIGRIRAEPWDVLLYDLVQQGRVIPNHSIGISHDAKTRQLPPNYISAMQTQALENPIADLLTCRYDYHIDGDPNSDVNKILQYWQFLRNERQKIIGRFPIPDANTAIRLGTYAALEGFDKNMRMREMSDFMRRLVFARREPEENTPFIKFVDDIYLAVDSRRVYRTINNGIAPHHTWDKLPFLTGDDPVRNMSSLEIANGSLDSSTIQRILDETDEVYLSRLSSEDAERIRTIGRQTFNLN